MDNERRNVRDAGDDDSEKARSRRLFLERLLYWSDEDIQVNCGGKFVEPTAENAPDSCGDGTD